jgi:cell division protein FtsB
VHRLRLPRLFAIGGLVLLGLFYWKPAHSYLHTKHELQVRHAEVRSLVAEQRRLKRRIAAVGTGDDLVREARRLDLVKPGEQLYIVKGIGAWRQQQRSH